MVNYPESVCFRTEHIAKEKVPELDWIQSSEGQTPLRSISVAFIASQSRLTIEYTNQARLR